MCKVLRAVESPLRGYNDLQDGFEELWNIEDQGRQRNLGLFSRLVRGVSRPCEPPRNPLFPLPNPLISPVTCLLGWFGA
jgi:hypothetical protein